jgi:hypothetical protein
MPSGRCQNWNAGLSSGRRSSIEREMSPAAFPVCQLSHKKFNSRPVVPTFHKSCRTLEFVYLPVSGSAARKGQEA